MRRVGFQRIGQQCTISDTEKERSWGDMNTPIKPEIKDSVRGEKISTTCSNHLHLCLNQQASEGSETPIDSSGPRVVPLIQVVKACMTMGGLPAVE